MYAICRGACVAYSAAENPLAKREAVHPESAADLESIRPNERILTQKEAVEIWAPLYDQMIALLLETTDNGAPCTQFPTEWTERASLLLQDYARLRNHHRRCTRFERPNAYYAQVRKFLEQAATAPHSLTPRDRGRLRTILDRCS